MVMGCSSVRLPRTTNRSTSSVRRRDRNKSLSLPVRSAAIGFNSDYPPYSNTALESVIIAVCRVFKEPPSCCP